MKRDLDGVREQVLIEEIVKVNDLTEPLKRSHCSPIDPRCPLENTLHQIMYMGWRNRNGADIVFVVVGEDVGGELAELDPLGVVERKSDDSTQLFTR